MFVGAVPVPVIDQILRTVDFSTWKKVFVGCSGSFRFDRSVKQCFPGVEVHSNDVSLLSCALGALASGEKLKTKFTGELAFIEDHLKGARFDKRVAAILVALQMAEYKSNNDFARAHFRHYREHFEEYLKDALRRVHDFQKRTAVDSFFAGDFRQQAERAKEAGGGVAAFPPTYKGGYERLYRFLHDNVEWDEPEYGVWDPSQLEGWVTELRDAGLRYCVIADHLLEGFEPATCFTTDTNRPVYSYVDEGNASYRRRSHKARPFSYTPVDSAKIGPDSQVDIVPAQSDAMNFIKDVYLAKNIHHTTGMANYLVFVDGMLVGGFIYSREKYGGDGVFLLSDFSISRERRLSKLVAMLATSRTVIARIEKRFMRRIRSVHTAVFTDKPVSMKYRGIFELQSRKAGHLNYRSEVREHGPQEIFQDWWQRHGRKGQRSADTHGPGQAGRSHAA